MVALQRNLYIGFSTAHLGRRSTICGGACNIAANLGPAMDEGVALKNPAEPIFSLSIKPGFAFAACYATSVTQEARLAFASHCPGRPCMHTTMTWLLYLLATVLVGTATQATAITPQEQSVTRATAAPLELLDELSFCAVR